MMLSKLCTAVGVTSFKPIDSTLCPTTPQHFSGGGALSRMAKRACQVYYQVVSSNHYARLTKLLDDDRVSGNIIHGGQTDESKLKFAPTMVLDPPEDSLIMNEEIFGPLLPIVTVEKIEDGISFINSRSKPLAAYLFTNNKKLKEEFVSNVSAGGVLINARLEG